MSVLPFYGLSDDEKEEAEREATELTGRKIGAKRGKGGRDAVPKVPGPTIGAGDREAGGTRRAGRKGVCNKKDGVEGAERIAGGAAMRLEGRDGSGVLERRRKEKEVGAFLAHEARAERERLHATDWRQHQEFYLCLAPWRFVGDNEYVAYEKAKKQVNKEKAWKRKAETERGERERKKERERKGEKRRTKEKAKTESTQDNSLESLPDHADFVYRVNLQIRMNNKIFR